MGTLFHAIFSGAAIGILVLGSGAFALRFFLGPSRSGLARGADVVTGVAIVSGLGFAILAGITGYYFTWGVAAVRESLVAQNKTLVTIALLVSYGAYLYLRYRFGDGVFSSWALRLWSGVLVAFGFVNLVLVGSMGGSATLKGTVLDPVLWALQINRYVSLSWGLWLNVALIALGAVLLFIGIKRRNGRRATR
jgi:hypothetical protein